MAIDKPLKYARLYLEGGIQIWVDAEDSLELWQHIFLYAKVLLIIQQPSICKVIFL